MTDSGEEMLGATYDPPYDTAGDEEPLVGSLTEKDLREFDELSSHPPSGCNAETFAPKAIYSACFRRNTVALKQQELDALREAQEGEGTKLARVLQWYHLIAYGLASTIGAGIFVVAGQVANENAGPALAFSFLIAAFSSLLSAFCYSEYAVRVPLSGSAYTFSYVTLGELIEVSVAEFSPELLSSRPGGRGAARGSSAVRMSCRRNDPLIVAAFHNVRDDVEAIGDFLAKAEEEFIERHGEQHASMRGQLDSMVDEHLESQCTQMDVFKNFEEFDGNVKKLQKTYFPNQGAPEKKEDIVSDDTLTETEDSDSRAERKAKKAAAGKSKLASASTDAPRETKNEPAEDQDD